MSKTWTRETLDGLLGIAARMDTVEKELALRVHEAIAESTWELGDVQAAHDAWMRCIAFQRDYLEDRSRRRAHMAATSYHVEKIQRQAEFERQQREAQQHLVDEIMLLNERLRRKSADLERLALEDGLTGIGNRRAFDQNLAREIGVDTGNNRPLAVALFDLNHFKLVNDRHSHLVGDEVLKHTARITRRHLGARQYVARLGGDEFAILLTGIAAEDAVTLCEGVRQRIAEEDWEWLAPGLRVTVSLGLTVMDAVLDAHTLIEAADRCLYLAKQSGRNAVVNRTVRSLRTASFPKGRARR